MAVSIIGRVSGSNTSPANPLDQALLSNYVLKSGDTMTGSLVVEHSNPESNISIYSNKKTDYNGFNLKMEADNHTARVFGSGIRGEANARFSFDAKGRMSWGDGANGRGFGTLESDYANRRVKVSRIGSATEPTLDDDLTTKKYVDDKFASIPTASPSNPTPVATQDTGWQDITSIIAAEPAMATTNGIGKWELRRIDNWVFLQCTGFRTDQGRMSIVSGVFAGYNGIWDNINVKPGDPSVRALIKQNRLTVESLLNNNSSVQAFRIMWYTTDDFPATNIE